MFHEQVVGHVVQCFVVRLVNSRSYLLPQASRNDEIDDGNIDNNDDDDDEDNDNSLENDDNDYWNTDMYVKVNEVLSYENASDSNMFVLYRGARQSIHLMGGSRRGGGGDIGPDDLIAFKSLVYSSVYDSSLFFSFLNYLSLFVFFRSCMVVV